MLTGLAIAALGLAVADDSEPSDAVARYHLLMGMGDPRGAFEVLFGSIPPDAIVEILLKFQDAVVASGNLDELMVRIELREHAWDMAQSILSKIRQSGILDRVPRLVRMYQNQAPAPPSNVKERFVPVFAPIPYWIMNDTEGMGRPVSLDADRLLVMDKDVRTRIFPRYSIVPIEPVIFRGELIARPLEHPMHYPVGMPMRRGIRTKMFPEGHP